MQIPFKMIPENTGTRLAILLLSSLVFILCLRFSLLFYLIFILFFCTCTQQNVSHSNTNSAIGFDKSIFFISTNRPSYSSLEEICIHCFLLIFCSIKAFCVIHLVSQVSFHVVGGGCKNNIYYVTHCWITTKLLSALYIIPNHVSFVRNAAICLKHIEYTRFRYL